MTTRSRGSADAGRQRGDHERSPVTAAMTIATCGETTSASAPAAANPNPCSEIRPAVVDAEHAAQQVLGRDLEDQRILTEHPRAAEARGNEQREGEREPGLAGERAAGARTSPPPARRSAAAARPGARTRSRSARPRSCRPGSPRATSRPRSRDEAEMRDVRRRQRLGRDRAGRHEPAEQQHAPDATIGEHGRHPAERVAQDVAARAACRPRRRAARGLRVARRTTRAEPRKLAQSSNSAPRGEVSAISSATRARCRRPAPTAPRCGRASGLR